MLVRTSILYRLLYLNVDSEKDGPLQCVVNCPRVPTPCCFAAKVNNGRNVSSFTRQRFSISANFLRVASIDSAHRVQVIISASNVPRRRVTQYDVIFHLPSRLGVHCFFIVNRHQAVHRVYVPAARQGVMAVRLHFVLVQVGASVHAKFRRRTIKYLRRVNALRQALVRRLGTFVHLMDHQFSKGFPNMVLIFVRIRIH